MPITFSPADETVQPGIGRLNIDLGPQPEDKDQPALADTALAALRQQNSLGSLIGYGMGDFKAQDNGFDPFKLVPDRYKGRASAYALADNQEEMDKVTARLDRELSDRDVLARSGVPGVLLQIGAGTVDPINLIPVGGAAYKTYSAGGSVLKAAAASAYTALATTTMQETVLQATQHERTFGESALNVAAGAMLAGLLGAGAGALVRNAGGKVEGFKTSAELEAALAKDLHLPAAGEKDLRNFEGTFEDKVREVKLTDANVNADGTIELSKPIDQTTGAGPDTLSAMRVRVVTRAQNEIANALGVDKAIAFQDPLLRVLGKSPSIRAAELVQQLSDVPFYLKKNYEGIANATSVEGRVRIRTGEDVWGPLKDVENLFIKHRMGRDMQLGDMAKTALEDLTGQTKGKLSYDEFMNEVGKAMRRGDEHAIPEVAAAAKRMRKVFDKYKDEAIALKMLPEDVKVETAPSYLSRVYNRAKIVARRDEFVKRLGGWLKRDNTDLADHEVEQLANFFTDRILGNAPGRTSYDMTIDPNAILTRKGTPGRASALKQRSLTIPDAEIEDFLENNAEHILRRYVRTLASDIELKKNMGSTNLEDKLDEIRTEYNALMNNAPSRAVKERLQKRLEADVRDITAVRDRLRHSYALPEDPGSLGNRVQNALLNYNYISKLGGMVLSAVPDIARPVMTHGLVSLTRDALVPLMRNVGRGREAYGIAMHEVEMAAVASEHVQNRAMSLAELTDTYGANTLAERGLQYASNKFGHLTGMNMWNTYMKQLNGLMVQTNMLRSITEGKNKPTLAMLGIDDQMAARIRNQFKEHGGRDRSIWFAGTDNWTDQEAAMVFKAGLSKEVNTIIVTPGVGDRPLWVSKPWLKLVAQFRSFFFSGMQRVVLRGAQQLRQGDMNVVTGMLAATTLGMAVSTFKAWQGGYQMKKTPEQFVLEGVDRAGITGWLFDANNILEKVTRGRVGLTAGVSYLSGDDVQPLSRFSTRNVWGAVLGPSFGTGEDLFKVIGSASAGEWSQSDTRALRRMIPYQNLWYVKNVFDRMEEGVDASFGVPVNEKRR